MHYVIECPDHCTACSLHDPTTEDTEYVCTACDSTDYALENRDPDGVECRCRYLHKHRGMSIVVSYIHCYVTFCSDSWTLRYADDRYECRRWWRCRLWNVCGWILKRRRNSGQMHEYAIFFIIWARYPPHVMGTYFCCSSVHWEL